MTILRRLILAISFQLGRAIAQFQRLLHRRGRSGDRPRLLASNPHWRRLRSQAGFVLPTTALLLVVVALTITALSLRTLNRTEQVVADRAQKVIYNAATPAIDRAKAKLEKLFTQDPRLTPNGVPSADYLMSMLLDRDITAGGSLAGFESLGKDPYTLPGEKQLDINGGGNDAAWTFPVDTDGNGQDDADVVYSILFTTPPPDPKDGQIKFDMKPTALQSRANALQTRTGPMTALDENSPCNLAATIDPSILPRTEVGWYQDLNKTSSLRKNFQVDAVVVPRTGADRSTSGAGTTTIATLEFQQDRLVEKGNKWGAWFRNDLELFSGGRFSWNGAMHTEGSMFWAGRANNPTRLYWVSAPGSCLYKNQEASVLSAASSSSQGIIKDFEGDFAATAVTSVVKDFGGANETVIDYQVGENVKENGRFAPDTDSVNASKAIDLTLDPLVLHTEDRSTRRKSGKYRDPAWNQNTEEFAYASRTVVRPLAKPYLDDFYRADNRYGPGPTYGRKNELKLTEMGKKVGENITGTKVAELTRNTNTGAEAQEVGADGYWERRAVNEGLRVIVGQRLELGSDPVAPLGYPSVAEEFDAKVPHQGLQRRSLRDLLSAVQGTLIFHKASNQGVKPVAAMVSTVHPGSPRTLKQSSTFERLPQTNGVKTKADWEDLFGPQFGDQSEELAIDFFNGRGTNGWEFDVDKLNELVAVSKSSSSTPVSLNANLKKALDNLALFAGDKDGAFPPKQEAGKTHPLPQLVKWGDFSNLRRALNNTNNSPADATTQQTAALDVGMLAYNIAYLDALDYSDGTIRGEVLDKLAEALGKVGDTNTDLAQKDEDLTDWPTGRTTDAADRKFGRVDIFRREPTGPFSVRVLPSNSNLRVPADTADSTNRRKFVEIQLASLKDDSGKPLASPPLLKRMETGKNSLPPGKNPFAKTTDNTDQVFPLVPPEAYVMALSEKRTTSVSLSDNRQDQLLPTELQQWARLIALREQIQRDRTFGFATHFGHIKKTGAANADDEAKHHYSYTIVNDLTPTPPPSTGPTGYAFGGRIYEKDKTYEFGCDFSKTTGNDYFGYGQPTNAAEEKRLIHLAGTLCPVEPKYPSLYYLFPRPISKDFALHDADGDKTPVSALEVGGAPIAVEVDHSQPKEADPFYTPYDKVYYDPYLKVAAGNFSVLTDAELKAIVIKPKALADWLLPLDKNFTPTGACANSAPNCASNLLIAVDNDGGKSDKPMEYHRVAFKDAALMNGRDRLVERTLDLDIDMLRQQTYAPGSLGDLWLTFGTVDPNPEKKQFGGMIYAFREDTTREDGIERSPSTGWAGYSIENASTRMRIDRTNVQGQDPPVTDSTGISPKPVDYYPDPDRRANGFRLINGRSVQRVGGGPAKENIYGLAFITDNPLFVKGDFNLHTVGGAPAEEFKTLLQRDTYSNFYSRGKDAAKDLNTAFARVDKDSWRPVELLADAITVLSNNFCDGSIRDTFIKNQPSLNAWYGCPGASPLGSPYTSFYGQIRPKTQSDVGAMTEWWHENRFDPDSPIAVSYTGQPIQRKDDDTQVDFGKPSLYIGDYETRLLGQKYGGSNTGVIPGATATEINAVFVSGIVPSRDDQSYGGFHNFLPMLENWGGSTSSQAQAIAGAFLQLNFRTSSTGPYDQDAWEIDQKPTGGNDDIPYYQIPKRLWGYDVGLQYAPAGPIASRFITIGDTRSEFYNEPASNDPYICALRKQVDPNADGC